MLCNQVADWNNTDTKLLKFPAILPHTHSKLIILFNFVSEILFALILNKMD
jgi:hypothetical protein